MAIPAVVGIPWLAGIIGSLFGGVLSFFAQYFTKRIAVIAAVIVLVTGATITVIGVFEGLLSSLAYVEPDFTYVGLFLPSNTVPCVAVMVTARITYWVYSWNVRVIQYKLNL